MKRWSIDERGVPWWSGGVDDRDARSLTDEDLSDLYAEDVASEMHAALVEAIHDAGRLRSLAAELDSHLNRGQKFTGAQVAVMLRAKAIA